MIEIIKLGKEISKISLNEITEKTLTWVDITNITEKEKDEIKEIFELHSLTVEDLFNNQTRIKVEEFDNYLFCVFYSFSNKQEINFTEIDFILKNNLLITNHKKKIDSIEILKNDNSKLIKLGLKGSDYLFHKILDFEIDNYLSNLDYYGDLISNLESNLVKNTNKNLSSEIMVLKKQITDIKKITTQHKDKISMLSKNDYSFISKKSKLFFRDVYDHSVKISENIESYKEAVIDLFNLHMSIISNNMNQVMKTLSIIATIALPLSVISGVYGTNFINVPGAKNLNGFWFMVIAMFILALSMIFYFKKKRWF